MEISIKRKLLGQRLTEARQSQRMSQQRAADIIGVSRVVLDGWEKGVACPDAIELSEIAMTYCICTHSLLFGVPWETSDVSAILFKSKHSAANR